MPAMTTIRNGAVSTRPSMDVGSAGQPPPTTSLSDTNKADSMERVSVDRSGLAEAAPEGDAVSARTALSRLQLKQDPIYASHTVVEDGELKRSTLDHLEPVSGDHEDRRGAKYELGPVSYRENDRIDRGHQRRASGEETSHDNFAMDRRLAPLDGERKAGETVKIHGTGATAEEAIMDGLSNSVRAHHVDSETRTYDSDSVAGRTAMVAEDAKGLVGADGKVDRRALGDFRRKYADSAEAKQLMERAGLDLATYSGDMKSLGRLQQSAKQALGDMGDPVVSGFEQDADVSGAENFAKVEVRVVRGEGPDGQPLYTAVGKATRAD